MQSIKVQQQELIMMNSSIESPVTVSAEQATVHATVMESINNGINFQESTTPDSNCSTNEKNAGSVPVEENTSGTLQSGTVLQNPSLKKWDGSPLQPGILYHRNRMVGLPECSIMENRPALNRATKWLEICRETGMAQPAKYVTASVVKQAGLTPAIIDNDGNLSPVPDGLIPRYYVKMDGHGRCAAHDIDLAQAKENPHHIPFDYIFLFDNMTDPNLFLKQFISINFDTKKTTNAELTGYAAAVHKDPYTEYYHDMLKDGYVAKAAAYYTFGKEPTRDDMKKINEGKTVNVSDEQVNAMRKSLDVYKNIFVGNASAKLLYGVPLAKWTHDKVKSFDNKEVFVAQIAQKFNSLDAKQIAKMQDAKGVKNDKTQTTEIVLRGLFEEIFNS